MSLGESCAFFDVDGTLIAEVSMLSFYQLQQRAERTGGHASRSELRAELEQRLRAFGNSREARLTGYYQTVLAGLSLQSADALCREWIASRRREPGFWLRGPCERLNQHKRAGVRPVLITGSFREVARAVAEELGVECWLCSSLEERDGHYTGRLTAPPMVGAAKRAAIEAFARERGVDLERSFAYGDDESDLPMLDRVGCPCVVDTAPPTLLAYARERGWPVLAAGADQPER